MSTKSNYIPQLKEAARIARENQETQTIFKIGGKDNAHSTVSRETWLHHINTTGFVFVQNVDPMSDFSYDQILRM